MRNWKLWMSLLFLAMSPALLWASEATNITSKLNVGGGLYELGAFVGAGISVGFGCVGAGIALSNIGSAAIGVISEKPEMMGKLLIMLGLAEALAIYGLVMGILLWIKI